MSRKRHALSLPSNETNLRQAARACAWEAVDADKAAQWLACATTAYAAHCYDHDHAVRIAQQIREGHLVVYAAPTVFTRDGQLLNHFNVLAGVIASGTGLPMRVFHGAARPRHTDTPWHHQGFIPARQEGHPYYGAPTVQPHPTALANYLPR